MAGFPSSMKSDPASWALDMAAARGAGAETGIGAADASPGGAASVAAPSLDLAKMVESEIIPRLMLAHRTPGGGDLASSRTPLLGPDSAESFARMVLEKEPESLIAYVGALLQSGMSLESVYVDLMAPAARRLGDYWNQDLATFTDVTIGLGRLQQVVRTLGYRIPQAVGEADGSRSALFAPTPGEQHTLGLFIIEDAFRRGGWRTWVESTGLIDEVLATVNCHWFDLLGFSVGVDTDVDEMAATISTVRKKSRNRALFIMVGGRFVMENPDIVSSIGADGTAANGADALLIADNAVRRLASQ